MSIGHGLCPVFGRAGGKSVLWTNISPYPVPVPAPRLLPASPPSAPPDLKQELVPSSRVPGRELQSVPPPAFVGTDTPSLSTETEPPPAPEATCRRVTPEHQRHGEQPGLMAFPPRLVAEQLTSMDAVSSGASRPGPGQACSLPSSAPNLPFPDVGLCGRGPDLSSTPYQPHHPVPFLKPLLSLPSCRPWS